MGRAGLAADVERNARLRHQVALVGGVDEHPPGERAARFHANRPDDAPLLRHAAIEIEPLSGHHLDAGLGEPLAVHALGNVRLEGPHLHLTRHLAAVLVVLLTLVHPGGRIGVLPAHTAVKLPRQATDRPLVADVGGPKATRRQPAEMPARLDDDDRPAERLGLDRRHDPSRGGAVDDDIACRFRRRNRPQSDPHDQQNHTRRPEYSHCSLRGPARGPFGRRRARRPGHRQSPRWASRGSSDRPAPPAATASPRESR